MYQQHQTNKLSLLSKLNFSQIYSILSLEINSKWSPKCLLFSQILPLSFIFYSIFKVLYLKCIFDHFYSQGLLFSVASRRTQDNIIHVNMAKKASYDQALTKLNSLCLTNNHATHVIINSLPRLFTHFCLYFPCSFFLLRTCPQSACIMRNHLSSWVNSSATLSISISKSSQIKKAIFSTLIPHQSVQFNHGISKY